MSARQDVIARVRAGVGKSDFANRRAVAEAWLTARQRGPQPAAMGDLLLRFCTQAEGLACTVDNVASSADAPAAVARYLDAGNLGRALVAAPELAAYDWHAAGIDAALRGAEDTDAVGVTGCFCAIAETGTLMLLSGAQTPATVSLLPETHIAFVEASRIVPTMEDAFALLRAEHAELPRAVNFISGPSRTGDIEQTIVLGAHGPCRVHLILIGENS